MKIMNLKLSLRFLHCIRNSFLPNTLSNNLIALNWYPDKWKFWAWCCLRFYCFHWSFGKILNERQTFLKTCVRKRVARNWTSFEFHDFLFEYFWFFFKRDVDVRHSLTSSAPFVTITVCFDHLQFLCSILFHFYDRRLLNPWGQVFRLITPLLLLDILFIPQPNTFLL